MFEDCGGGLLRSRCQETYRQPMVPRVAYTCLVAATDVVAMFLRLATFLRWAHGMIPVWGAMFNSDLADSAEVWPKLPPS